MSDDNLMNMEMRRRENDTRWWRCRARVLCDQKIYCAIFINFN
jgi:hypothetical protein